MNLEKEPNDGLHVLPSLIPDEEWEWRQHYRVWEANRKIFLWPENYLDPTIRDDKTPLFEELESELCSKRSPNRRWLTPTRTTSRVLKNWQTCDTPAPIITTPRTRILVRSPISFTSSVLPVAKLYHYWREIRNLARSQEDALVSPEHGPWRKVETRIPTRHLSPVVYDGQLHVFWNEITTTSQNAVNDGKSRFIGYSHRCVLKFTLCAWMGSGRRQRMRLSRG